MKIVWIYLAVIMLSGCELLEQKMGPLKDASVNKTTFLCETDEALETFEEFCQVRAWAEFYIDADQTPWSLRHESIKSLGDEPKQQLQKVLLSQGIDTPYANRLRAQNWLSDISSLMDERMNQVATVFVQKPSQQMLELESAITILSRVNARQEKTITDLQETLNIRSDEMQKQREQVEQLLKIEADMSDEKRSN
ncbi:hypothetical protein ACFO4O_01975 [Glaciecola siphonariae]|uniref:YfhG lipoprotein n=1 Tax=Glaciecola siphonariae TaxID=521012 RepID=A0ABV9LR33_9ALTE